MPVIQGRTKFDQDDDGYLVKYIAKYNPGIDGRCGNSLYKTLVANEDALWPWAKYHTWQSWRDRYYKNRDRFDAKIRVYQKKHGIEEDEPGPSSYTRPVEIEQNVQKKLKKKVSEVRDDEGGDKPMISSQEGSQQRHNAARKVTVEGNGQTPSRTTELPLLSDSSSDDDDFGENSQNPKSGAPKRKLDTRDPVDERTKKRRTSERAVQYEEVVLERDVRSTSNLDATKSKVATQVVETEARPDTLAKSPLVKRIRESLSALGQLEGKELMRLLQELGLSLADHKAEPTTLSQANGNTTPARERSSRGSLYPDLSQELEYVDMHVGTSGLANSTAAETRSQGTSEQQRVLPRASSNDNARSNTASTLLKKPPSSPPTSTVKTKDDGFVSLASISESNGPKIGNFPHEHSDQDTTKIGSSDSVKEAISDEPTNLLLMDQSTAKMDPKSDGKRSLIIARPSSVRRTIELDTSSDSDTGVMGTNNVNSRNWPPSRRGTKNRYTKQTSSADTREKTQIRSENRIPRDQGDSLPTLANDNEVVKAAEIAESGTFPMQLANPRVSIAVPKQSPSTPNSLAGPSKVAPRTKTPTSIPNSQSTRKTPATGDTIPSVPPVSATDPFITAEHVQRLKSLEKRKRKETTDDHVASTRRLTFGGFSTRETSLPKVDLRKKIQEKNRYSLDWRVLSTKAASPTIRESHKHRDSEGSSRSRRTSFITTIDLAEEVPSPAHGIPPSDQALINRAGLQFFVQAMAQNHGVSEEWVRRVYEERQSLPDTDRILGEMRAAAERVFEEAMQRDANDSRLSAAANVTLSSQPSTRATLAEELLREMNPGSVDSNRSPHDNILSIADQESERGLRLNDAKASHTVANATQQRNELHFTPTDPREELKRALGRYAPPSSSRAARYVRHARRSTGMSNSPTKHSPRTTVTGDAQYDISDDDKEVDEVENSPALSRPLGNTERTHSPDSASDKENDEFGSLRPNRGVLEPPGNRSVHAQAASELIWSKEEDAILERGEDDGAMQAIIERRGKGAVRRRLVELMFNDENLFG